jgi:CDP-diacylglycerol--glycerol-3-phosphate 3-phosphatidyltransferase
MNTANYLSASRIVLTPLAVAFMVTCAPPYREAAAAFVTLIVGASDWLDGYWARRSGSVSKLGTYLDATADKVFVLSMLICLGQLGYIPMWMVYVVLVRDLLINGLRSYASSRGIIIPSRFWGKLKTTVTLPAIFFLIISPPGTYFYYPSLILMFVATLLSVISGLLYLYDSRGILREREIFHKGHSKSS